MQEPGRAGPGVRGLAARPGAAVPAGLLRGDGRGDSGQAAGLREQEKTSSQCGRALCVPVPPSWGSQGPQVLLQL